MHDAVADAADARAAVTLAQPAGDKAECRATVLTDAVQLTIGDGLARAVLGGELRGRADALDLSARFEPPAFGRRPAEHAELQAR